MSCCSYTYMKLSIEFHTIKVVITEKQVLLFVAVATWNFNSHIKHITSWKERLWGSRCNMREFVTAIDLISMNLQQLVTVSRTTETNKNFIFPARQLWFLHRFSYIFCPFMREPWHGHLTLQLLTHSKTIWIKFHHILKF